MSTVSLRPAAAVLTLALTFAVLLQAPASAANQITLSPNGTLRIEIDPAVASATLTCVGGDVFHNGLSTGFACADVTAIIIVGSGAADLISVVSVNAFSFTQVPTIEISGRGGSDTISLGLSEESVDGGPGEDSMTLNPLIGTTITLTDTKVKQPGDPTSIASIEVVTADLQIGTNLFDASAFSGEVNVDGNTGQDTIIGTRNGDVLSGGSSGDTLIGGRGPDEFDGGAGNDTLTGGPGPDSAIFVGLTSNITVTDSSATSSMLGNDTLDGLEFIEVGQDPGTALNDVDFSGFSGHAFWLGSTGNDVVAGAQGGTVFWAGPGNDVMIGNAPAPSFATLSEGDVIYTQVNGAATFGAGSSTSSDGVDAYSGIDLALVFGSANADTVTGTGFTGILGLILGEGNDVGVGSPQDDFFSTEDDDDFDGDAGRDTVGNGVFQNEQVLTDTSYTSPSSTIALQEIEYADLHANTGSSIDASAWTGDTMLEGWTGRETLIGGQGRDVLLGAENGDRLRGGPGKDRISGGPGNDRLNGGADKDTCFGDAGRDRRTACERGSAAPAWAPVDIHGLVEDANELAGGIA